MVLPSRPDLLLPIQQLAGALITFCLINKCAGKMKEPFKVRAVLSVIYMPNQKRDAKADGKQLQAELATMRRLHVEQHTRMIEVMEDMRSNLGMPPRVESGTNTDLTGVDIRRFEHNEGRNKLLY